MSNAHVDRIEDEASERRQPRRWWLIALLFAAPLAVVGLVYVIACWRAHAILKHEIEQIAARGEPVRFSDLAPPPHDSATARGRKLAVLINKLDRAPSELLNQTIVPPPANVLAGRVQQMVDQYRSDVQAIVDIAREGECRFEYDFQTHAPYNILLPHVQYLSNAYRLLAVECHLAIAKGDRRLAMERFRDMLDLDEVLRHDPFAVSQLNRRANGNRSLEALQFLLSEGAPSEKDLAFVDERLKAPESSFRLASCMRAERALLLAEMENLGRSDMTQALADNSRGVSPTKAAALNYWWGSWLYRSRRLYEEAVMLRTMSHWSELVDSVGPVASAQFVAAGADCRASDFPVFHELVTQGIEQPKLRELGLTYRQRFITARFALAVVRHRMIHGQLPDSLKELEQPPIDEPIGLLSGKPLTYKKRPDGFAIYDDLPEQGRFEVKFAIHSSGHSEH